ncbi:MAG: hypothetical protein NTX79_06640 [Candidatus Micrarchaeota archaeon]|nr:hypothetical protein [Candidatus Micrarchaeota archaeon]
MAKLAGCILPSEEMLGVSKSVLRGKFFNLRKAAFRTLYDGPAGGKGKIKLRDITFESVASEFARMPMDDKRAFAQLMMRPFNDGTDAMKFAYSAIDNFSSHSITPKEAEAGVFSVVSYVLATCLLAEPNPKDNIMATRGANSSLYDNWTAIAGLFNGVDEDCALKLAAKAQFIYAVTQDVTALAAFCKTVGSMEANPSPDKAVAGVHRLTMGDYLDAIALKTPRALITVCSMLDGVKEYPAQGMEPLPETDADTIKLGLANKVCGLIAVRDRHAELAEFVGNEKENPVFANAERGVCVNMLCKSIGLVNDVDKNDIAATLVAIFMKGGRKAMLGACMAIDPLPPEHKGRVATRIGEIVAELTEGRGLPIKKSG